MIKLKQITAIFCMIFILISMTCLAFAAPDTSFQCETRHTDVKGAKQVKATFALDESSDPLLVVSSQSDKELNFKVGRKNVAGTTVNESDGDECTPTLEATDNILKLDYNCDFISTNGDGSKERMHDLESSLSLSRNVTQGTAFAGTLCKSIGQSGADCWQLENCK